MLRVAVVGCGYWGPNLIRNFAQLPNVQMKCAVDLNKERLRHIKQLYPSVETTTDLDSVISSPDIDACVVATPVSTHHPIAKRLLEAGKHVLVEKPMAASIDEAEELKTIADERGLVLMAGHTFLYTAAVNKMRDLIASGELGHIYYISTTRVNLGLFQEDINVIWDLAPHDISILNYILGAEPETVSATGQAYIQAGIEDVAFANLTYPGDIVAHVHVSWLNPDKIRRTTVVGSKKMLVFDDVSMQEKIRVFDKGVSVQPHYDTFGEFQLSYRFGDIYTPRLDDSEPLKNECQHFVHCIQKQEKPRSNGEAGLAVVRVMQRACESIQQG
ncbi:MAG: Gfo/Idh/MocA family oxidoreductase, partial [Gemmatimonadetes bacterium]|nr:Gfo/Idh/MocA family oxidoreductase [Gemmatimonadota bacterium]